MAQAERESRGHVRMMLEVDRQRRLSDAAPAAAAADVPEPDGKALDALTKTRRDGAETLIRPSH